MLAIGVVWLDIASYVLAALLIYFIAVPVDTAEPEAQAQPATESGPQTARAAW